MFPFTRATHFGFSLFSTHSHLSLSLWLPIQNPFRTKTTSHGGFVLVSHLRPTEQRLVPTQSNAPRAEISQVASVPAILAIYAGRPDTWRRPAPLRGPVHPADENQGLSFSLFILFYIYIVLFEFFFFNLWPWGIPHGSILGWMNICLPPILLFTRGTGFSPTAIIYIYIYSGVYVYTYIHMGRPNMKGHRQLFVYMYCKIFNVGREKSASRHCYWRVLSFFSVWVLLMFSRGCKNHSSLQPY